MISPTPTPVVSTLASASASATSTVPPASLPTPGTVVTVVQTGSTNPALSHIAHGVTWWQVLVALAVGAAVGLAIGAVAVLMERWEKLEAEEDEEYLEAEAEWKVERDLALKQDKSAPPPLVWVREHYGFSWLERWFAPVVTAVLFAVFTLHHGAGLALYTEMLWIAVLVHITIFDLKHRLVLNKVSLPMLLVALGLSFVTPDLSFGMALQGALVLGIGFFLLHLINRRGLGLGDAKLVALLGAITGLDLPGLVWNALYAVCIGVVGAGMMAIVLLAIRRSGRRDYIPYAPFLCAGALFVLYAGI